MDYKQAQIVELYQEGKLKDDDIDEDELFELLDEDDNALQQYREARIEQLSREFKKINETSDLGNITEFDSEKQLMDDVAKSEYAIVHFYQPGFVKCKKMNEKLELLAEKHLSLKIYSIKAETATFLVNKLKIKVLPFVVIYKNGVELTRLVGFERLGNDPNDFSYTSLEQLLIGIGVINRQTIKTAKAARYVDSDSDLDI